MCKGLEGTDLFWVGGGRLFCTLALTIMGRVGGCGYVYEEEMEVVRAEWLVR